MFQKFTKFKSLSKFKARNKKITGNTGIIEISSKINVIYKDSFFRNKMIYYEYFY